MPNYAIFDEHGEVIDWIVADEDFVNQFYPGRHLRIDNPPPGFGRGWWLDEGELRPGVPEDHPDYPRLLAENSPLIPRWKRQAPVEASGVAGGIGGTVSSEPA